MALEHYDTEVTCTNPIPFSPHTNPLLSQSYGLSSHVTLNIASPSQKYLFVETGGRDYLPLWTLVHQKSQLRSLGVEIEWKRKLTRCLLGERQKNIALESVNFVPRLLGFESQPHHLLVILGEVLTLPMPQLLHL